MWLKNGNHKLHKGVKVWNLPAGMKTCNRVCEGCYAIKAEKGRYGKAVIEAREKRYQLSLSPDFVPAISGEISRARSAKYVRVHESGDFYSQEYINDWVEIAKQNPSMVFFAYTKRMKHFDFTEMQNLSNFVLIDSLKFGGLNYDIKENIQALHEKTGAMVCPYDKPDTVCGLTCTYCMTKEAQDKGVLFIKH